MSKKYVKIAFAYAVAALVFGVFFREFTKFTGFTGKTSLSVMHVHYLVLGAGFFLLFALLQKSFGFVDKTVEKLEIVYHAGLNVASLAFLMRGITQITLGENISRGFDAAISGIAGMGHIALGVSLLFIIIKLIKKGSF